MDRTEERTNDAMESIVELVRDDRLTALERTGEGVEHVSAHPGDAGYEMRPSWRRRILKGSALFHEGAEARSIYRVLAGDFKLVRTEEDGYEQVLDFLSSRDLLGLDALDGGVHGYSAVALDDSSVTVIAAADVRAWCAMDPTLDAGLRASYGRAVRRLADMAWLTAAPAADRRVARFLLLMSRRAAARGESPRRLHLPMRRRDIASYLGMAHESATRGFTALAAAGILNVNLREVEIVDRDGLETFARTTRVSLEGDPASRSRTALGFVREAAVC